MSNGKVPVSEEESEDREPRAKMHHPGRPGAHQPITRSLPKLTGMLNFKAGEESEGIQDLENL